MQFTMQSSAIPTGPTEPAGSNKTQTRSPDDRDDTDTEGFACDCHFHVFNRDGFAVDARYVPAYAAAHADWQACAARALVKCGIVVQPSFLGTDNRLLLDTLNSHRDHLRGVAVIDASANASALEHLHANGVRGIRLNLAGEADDVHVMRTLPASFWSALITAQLHLELHSDIGRIAALLPLVPLDLTVVLDHFGKPMQASLTDTTVHAVCHRQRAGGDAYITLSGAYRLRSNDARAQKKLGTELAALWRDEIGRERLLWGSDWPCTRHESEANYAALRDSLDSWLPDADDRYAALQINPQRLYWR